MSAKLDLFIERMQGDWDLISNVPDDPASGLSHVIRSASATGRTGSWPLSEMIASPSSPPCR